MLKIIFLLLTLVMLTVGNPIESETPAEDRSLIAPYDINPYFGFRKYGELRYEPLSLPFYSSSQERNSPAASSPDIPSSPNYSSMPYSQQQSNLSPAVSY